MRRFQTVLTLLLLCCGVSACSTARVHYPPATLQEGLDRVVKDLHLEEAAKSKHIGIALLDISNPEAPAFAGVNDSEMMYAASLPKIAILFGLFKRVENGSMTLTPELQAEAEAMIRASSNEAATDLFYAVGPEYIQSLLLSPAYGLYDERRGGLWVGKEYGKGPALRRDPIANLSHAASPDRVALFYYLLETGALVDPRLAPQMKAVLGNSQLDHQFVRGMREYCPRAKLLRKSGSWGGFFSDSALVSHGNVKYIAVGLVNDPDGRNILEKLIVKMDKLITDNTPVGCHDQA